MFIFHSYGTCTNVDNCNRNYVRMRDIFIKEACVKFCMCS